MIARARLSVLTPDLRLSKLDTKSFNRKFEFKPVMRIL